MWGEPMAGYQVSAKPEKNAVQSAEPIVFQVTLKNVGQAVLIYALANKPVVEFSVKDEKGQIMPLTRYGQDLFKPAAGTQVFRLIQVKLKPGEERTYRLLVNDMYDMTVPGDYTIVAKKTVSNGAGGSVEVTSNAVKVTVNGFDASMPSDPLPEEETKK